MFMVIFMLGFIALWACIHILNWIGKGAIKQIVETETSARDALIKELQEKLVLRDTTIEFLRKSRHLDDEAFMKAAADYKRDLEYAEARMKHWGIA